MTCPANASCTDLTGTSYDQCAEQADYAVLFLDHSFAHTLTYGYSDSLPVSETLYTGQHQHEQQLQAEPTLSLSAATRLRC